MANIFAGINISEKDKQKLLKNTISLVLKEDNHTGSNVWGVLGILVDNSGLPDETRKALNDQILK
ncbi:MAG TPA: hypothetical protein P5052_01985 [Candidatus Paceibacterota bacterium]|jgi:hypothetical protein|nr:hypothetical protein [Candidatus Paceibacterota bacterium]HRZ29524.1 hypothetical protein [Candidatus Paceibacterota bacterium]